MMKPKQYDLIAIGAGNGGQYSFENGIGGGVNDGGLSHPPSGAAPRNPAPALIMEEHDPWKIKPNPTKPVNLEESP